MVGLFPASFPLFLSTNQTRASADLWTLRSADFDGFIVFEKLFPTKVFLSPKCLFLKAAVGCFHGQDGHTERKVFWVTESDSWWTSCLEEAQKHTWGGKSWGEWSFFKRSQPEFTDGLVLSDVRRLDVSTGFIFFHQNKTEPLKQRTELSGGGLVHLTIFHTAVRSTTVRSGTVGDESVHAGFLLFGLFGSNRKVVELFKGPNRCFLWFHLQFISLTFRVRGRASQPSNQNNIDSKPDLQIARELMNTKRSFIKNVITLTEKQRFRFASFGTSLHFFVPKNQIYWEWIQTINVWCWTETRLSLKLMNDCSHHLKHFRLLVRVNGLKHAIKRRSGPLRRWLKLWLHWWSHDSQSAVFTGRRHTGETNANVRRSRRENFFSFGI